MYRDWSNLTKIVTDYSAVKLLIAATAWNMYIALTGNQASQAKMSSWEQIYIFWNAETCERLKCSAFVFILVNGMCNDYSASNMVHCHIGLWKHIKQLMHDSNNVVAQLEFRYNYNVSISLRYNIKLYVNFCILDNLFHNMDWSAEIIVSYIINTGQRTVLLKIYFYINIT